MGLNSLSNSVQSPFFNGGDRPTNEFANAGEVNKEKNTTTLINELNQALERAKVAYAELIECKGYWLQKLKNIEDKNDPSSNILRESYLENLKNIQKVENKHKLKELIDERTKEMEEYCKSAALTL